MRSKEINGDGFEWVFEYGLIPCSVYDNVVYKEKKGQLIAIIIVFNKCSSVYSWDESNMRGLQALAMLSCVGASFLRILMTFAKGSYGNVVFD